MEGPRVENGAGEEEAMGCACCCQRAEELSEEVERLTRELDEAKETLGEFHGRHCGLVPCKECGSTDCETVVSPARECAKQWRVADILKWYDETQERRRGGRASDA